MDIPFQIDTTNIVCFRACSQTVWTNLVVALWKLFFWNFVDQVCFFSTFFVHVLDFRYQNLSLYFCLTLLSVLGQKIIFFLRLVTVDETWVHYYEPENKAQSRQWVGPGSPRPKKFKTQPSAGKVMATVFWDAKRVTMLDILCPATKKWRGIMLYPLKFWVSVRPSAPPPFFCPQLLLQF